LCISLTDAGTIVKDTNPELALQFYDCALQHNPKHGPTYHNLGVLFSEHPRLVSWISGPTVATPNSHQNGTAIISSSSGNNSSLGNEAKRHDDQQAGNASVGSVMVNSATITPSLLSSGNMLPPQTSHKDRAILFYELACHFSPKGCAEALNNLGVLYREKGNMEKAGMCYVKALEINPQCARTIVNLAVLMTHQGRVDEAHRLCSMAIEADPKYAEVNLFPISFCAQLLLPLHSALIPKIPTFVLSLF
jgi:tetratricopeptide (TPR) repeat protein